MAKPGYYGYRLSEERWALLAPILDHLRLQVRDRGAVGAALDFALRVANENLLEKGEKEMDRVSQVNWLRELAGNITANLGWGTAEELVDYALSDEGRDDWGIEIPEWFDDHDRASLVRFVAESL